MSPRAPGDEVPRRAHERLWLRDGFEWWDAVWDRLDVAARRAFIGIAADEEPLPEELTAHTLKTLLDQGLVETTAKAQLLVTARARQFARRIAHLAGFPVLRDGDPCVLAEHLRASCDEDGLRALHRLVIGANLPRREHPADAAAAAIADGTWQQAGARLASRTGAGALLLAHLRQAPGPVPQTVVGRVLGARDWTDGLDALLALLLTFEGLDPATLALEVGLGPPRTATAPVEDPLDEVEVVEDELEAHVPTFAGHPDPQVPDRSLHGSGRAEPALHAPSLHVSSPAAPAPASSSSSSSSSKGKRKRGRKEGEPEPTPEALACNGVAPVDVALAPVDAVPPLLLDCEELLVHLAGERVRLTRGGQIYAEQAERLEGLFAARPSRFAPARRLDLALAVLSDLELVAQLEAGPVTIVRPGPRAVEWLARPVASRQREVCDLSRAGRVARWLGGPLEHLAERVGPWPQEQGSLDALLEPIRGLAPDRTYDLGDVLLSSAGPGNPLLALFSARLARLGRRNLDTLALLRTELRWVFFEVASEDPLVVLDRRYREGIVAALDWVEHLGGGRLVVSGSRGEARALVCLTRVGRWHLGFDPDPPPVAPDGPPPRVVVQPNLDVLVIGRAPAACCSLARFAVARAGEAGPARTFTLDRERVVEAVAEGLSPAEIEAALVETGGAVPDNVRRTVRDWASAVRRARVVHVPVLVTDDEETALTIRAAAGKGVLLGGHQIPVDPAKLSAFKKALRKRGIVVD